MARDDFKRTESTSNSPPLTKNLRPIALFGTSADPPTYGHQALLEGLLSLFPRVITWASDNPMKHHGASLEKRHELLNALVKGINNTNLELVQELSSPWTISTLKLANQFCPNSEFIFIIGSDLTGQIPNWYKAETLLKKLRIGIAPREGWPIQTQHLSKIETLGGQVELLPLKIPSTASSEVRSNPRIDQIPNAVLPILLEQNLYGLKHT